MHARGASAGVGHEIGPATAAAGVAFRGGSCSVESRRCPRVRWSATCPRPGARLPASVRAGFSPAIAAVTAGHRAKRSAPPLRRRPPQVAPPRETPAERWARHVPSARHAKIVVRAARPAAPSAAGLARPRSQNAQEAAPDVFRAIPAALEPGLKSPCWRASDGKLRCMPLAHILGVRRRPAHPRATLVSLRFRVRHARARAAPALAGVQVRHDGHVQAAVAAPGLCGEHQQGAALLGRVHLPAGGLLYGPAHRCRSLRRGGRAGGPRLRPTHQHRDAAGASRCRRRL